MFCSSFFPKREKYRKKRVINNIFAIRSIEAEHNFYHVFISIAFYELLLWGRQINLAGEIKFRLLRSLFLFQPFSVNFLLCSRNEFDCVISSGGWFLFWSREKSNH
jgi:hypothetical protein